ncbi:MAG: head-tail connector protein [candidate division WOR-3 bacterium]
MPLNMNALTTVANLKRYLDIEDNSHDSLLEELINRATLVIESLCNRKFKNLNSNGELQTVTEYHDGGTSSIRLKYYPVSEIVAVYEDPGREFGADTLLDSSEYTVDEESGILKFDAGNFIRGNKTIKVVYKGGYTTSPYDLEQVCIELAGILFKSTDTLGTSSKSFADGSAAFYENRLSLISREVIERYRRIDH